MQRFHQGKKGKNLCIDCHREYIGCSLCMYTPLKGVLRYQVNKEDVELFKIGAERMLEKLGDLERAKEHG